MFFSMTPFLLPLVVFSPFLSFFDVTVHLGLKTYKFDNLNVTSFVFEFTDDFLITFIVIWLVLWIVVIVEFIFVIPKVLIDVLSFYFVS